MHKARVNFINVGIRATRIYGKKKKNVNNNIWIERGIYRVVLAYGGARVVSVSIIIINNKRL